MPSKFLKKYKPLFSHRLQTPACNLLYKPVDLARVEFSVYDSIQYEYNYDIDKNEKKITKMVAVHNRIPREFASVNDIEDYLVGTHWLLMKNEKAVINLYKFAPVFEIEYLCGEVMPEGVICKYLPTNIFALSSELLPLQRNCAMTMSGKYIVNDYVIGVTNSSLAHSTTVDFYINEQFTEFCNCKECGKYSHVSKARELLWFLQSRRNRQYLIERGCFRITHFVKNTLMRRIVNLF